MYICFIATSLFAPTAKPSFDHAGETRFRLVRIDLLLEAGKTNVIECQVKKEWLSWDCLIFWLRIGQWNISRQYLVIIVKRVQLIDQWLIWGIVK